MVTIKHSIRAVNGIHFKLIQQISRYSYKILQEQPKLVEEFICLRSEKFNFVYSWDNNSILPSTMALYSKKLQLKMQHVSLLIDSDESYHNHRELKIISRRAKINILTSILDSYHC